MPAERMLLPMELEMLACLLVGLSSLLCYDTESCAQSDSSSHSTEEEPLFEGKTGSGSLLSTSESDGWNGRSGLPWPGAVNTTSPILSRTNSHNLSPLRQRTGDQSSLHITDLSGRPSAASSVNRPHFGQMTDHASPNLQLSVGSSLGPQGTNINTLAGFEPFLSGEEQQQPGSRTTSFGSNALACSAPSAKHYAVAGSESSVRSSAVFQPTSSSRTNIDMQTGTYFRPSASLAKSNMSQTNASRAFHRPLHSTDASLDNTLGGVGDHVGSTDENLASEMERLQLYRNDHFSQRSGSNHRPTFSSQMSYDISMERSNFRTVSNERFHSGQSTHVPESSSEHGFQYPPAYYRGVPYSSRDTSSPSMSESRGEFNSSYYSTATTPPMAPGSIRASSGSGSSSRASNAHVHALDRNLRGLQSFQVEQQILRPNPLQMRSSYQQQGDTPYHAQMQMNPLARPYAMPPYSTYSNVQSVPSQNARYSRVESESNQVIRSAVLEDFRTNSKTNKRYELKVSSRPARGFWHWLTKPGHLHSCG